MIWLDDANLLKNRYVFTIHLLRKLETYLSSRSLRYSFFNEIELKDWIERNKFLKITKNTIIYVYLVDCDLYAYITMLHNIQQWL